MHETPELDHPALRPRTALDSLAPYSAGRDARAVRRDTGYAGPVIKLASNEGAVGPFSSARLAIESGAAAVQRYPDAHAGPLAQALGSFHRVPVDQVMVANGGCALISHLSSAFLEPGDEVVMGRPTFHLYRLEALRMGAVPVEVPLGADGAYDLGAMARVIGPRTRIAYVCTPNNPTGGLVPRAALSRFLEELPPRVLPIVDEAYFEFVDHPDYDDPIRYAPPCRRPVIVIRTFSKIYGLAGLRIGYAIADKDVIAACRKIQNPYEVNRIAQAAARASIDDAGELALRRAQNRTSRDRLIAGLRALALSPFPSQGNFVCVSVGDGRAVAAALEARGMIVRPLEAMGDPTSIRITVGTTAEVDAVLQGLAAVLSARQAP